MRGTSELLANIQSICQIELFHTGRLSWMALYGAAILDVVGSKVMDNRERLQDRLNEAIGDFNARFRNLLPVPAGITIGDEWEFLTGAPKYSYELIQWFQDTLRLARIEVYAGLGIGGLSTAMGPEIRQMDGSCFHLARRAVAIAKGIDGSRHKYIFSKKNRVYLLADNAGGNGSLPVRGGWEEAAAAGGRDGFPLTLQEMANAMIENTEILKVRMSEKQRLVFLEYQRLGSYRKMAAESGIRQTPGGISQKLNTAEYFSIKRNVRLIGILLEMMAGEGRVHDA